MNIHNIMEEHVAKRVNGLYDSLKKENISWLSCDCESCRLDTISFVLNRIPPRYIVSGRGVNHFNADTSFRQTRIDINALIMEGIRLVSSVKRPYHNEIKIEEKIVLTEKPIFNFPSFEGQIFDGSNFEPLEGAQVLLLINGQPAKMKDETWSNPSPILKSTEGHYTFWVSPEIADKENISKEFDFTIEITAPGYETEHYSFPVTIVSEKIDRSKFNASYSLHVQDLFLFKDNYDEKIDFSTF